MLNNVIAKNLFTFNVYLRSSRGVEMDAFYQKCSRHYIIQGDGCLVYYIPKHRSFNLDPAVLDCVSVTHFIFQPSVKSLASLRGHVRCIYLCILLHIMYSGDYKTEYFL